MKKEYWEIRHEATLNELKKRDAEIAELKDKLYRQDKDNKAAYGKLHQRQIQIADLKNKLIKAQERNGRLQDRFDEVQQVNDNYLKEICDLKGKLIKKLS